MFSVSTLDFLLLYGFLVCFLLICCDFRFSLWWWPLYGMKEGGMQGKAREIYLPEPWIQYNFIRM